MCPVVSKTVGPKKNGKVKKSTPRHDDPQMVETLFIGEASEMAGDVQHDVVHLWLS